MSDTNLTLKEVASQLALVSAIHESGTWRMVRDGDGALVLQCKRLDGMRVIWSVVEPDEDPPEDGWHLSDKPDIGEID